MQTKNKTCLICGNNSYKTIYNYDVPDQYENKVGVSSKNYYREWVQCTECDFLYSIYSRDESILDTIYTESYRDKNTAWRNGTTEEIFDKVVKLPPSESETKFRLQWIKTNMEQLWSHGIATKESYPLNLLDIGGGNAIFAYEFQDENWNVHIVDANESGEFIEKKLKIPFVQSYYRSNLFDHRFDLISLVFVLEHLKDPKLILEEVYNDLNSESFLYIEIPDANCFELKEKDDDIFNSCHLYMYSPKSLASLLDQCGFEILCLNRVKTVRNHLAIMLLARKKQFTKS